MNFVNLSATEEACFEWQIGYLFDQQEWQIDLIQILKESSFDGYFEHIAERINLFLPLLVNTEF